LHFFIGAIIAVEESGLTIEIAVLNRERERERESEQTGTDMALLALYQLKCY